MTQSDPLFRAPTESPPAPVATPVAADRDLAFYGRDETLVRIRGRVLAHGSSERDEHNDHPGEYATRTERCSACRWFEVSIAAVTADVSDETCTCSGLPGYDHEPHCGLEPPSGRYLVVTAGRSVVPGEMNFRRAEFTDSPLEVVELLRVEPARERARREERGVPDSEANRTLPPTSARALAQAAAHDDDLRDAYLAYVAAGGTRA